MPETAIQRWLRAAAVEEAVHSALFGVGTLLGGAAVTGLTGLVLFGLVWALLAAALDTGSALLGRPAPAVPALAVAGVVVVLLGGMFQLNAVLTWAHLEPRLQTERQALRLPPGHRRLPALMSLLAYPGSSRRAVLDVLLTGPRLCMIAWTQGRRALRLWRMDLVDGARVLLCLGLKGSRLSFEELAARAGLRDPLRTFLDLRELSGVIFLSQEPSGLTLTGEWRSALREAVGPEAWQWPDGWTEAERNAAAVRSLHELLGLNPTASGGEVDAAVQRRLRACGRREVVRGGDALGQFAEAHARAVGRAYDALRAGGPAAPGTSGPDAGALWEERRVWPRSSATGPMRVGAPRATPPEGD